MNPNFAFWKFLENVFKYFWSLVVEPVDTEARL